jgi:hypothetical protein
MTNPDAAATKQREEEEKNHLATLKGKTQLNLPPPTLPM